MRKIVCYLIMIVHLAIALFYANQLYDNIYSDVSGRIASVFLVVTIVFLLSIWACFNQRAMVYSLFSFVLVIGFLVWVGGFVFSGVYVFTLAASILILIDERRGRF